MPLTTDEYRQLIVAIDLMDGLNLVNYGRVVSAHNVLVLLSEYVTTDPETRREINDGLALRKQDIDKKRAQSTAPSPEAQKKPRRFWQR